jgi:putative two-component system response regulator
MSKDIRVLVVDDHQVVREGLKHLLGHEEDIEIVGQCASSGEALSKLGILRPNVILMDIKMPEVDGIQLTHLITQKTPACNVIMLTLYEEYISEAIKAGARGYLLKDSKREEITDAIRRVHRGQLVIGESIKRARIMGCPANGPLRKTENTRTIFEEIIQAMASTVELRDPYTAGHQRRVTQLAVAIANQMCLTGEQVCGLRLASLVHDIGKTKIPVEILTTPLKLTGAEYSIIKTHPTVAYEILKTIDFPLPIAKIVYQHHERIDGSGYPEGVTGEAIILESKILAVADVVEAMSSYRPYRPAIGMDKALEEISDNKGNLYDPGVVDACIEICGGTFKFSQETLVGAGKVAD